jgi:hypothetical protein
MRRQTWALGANGCTHEQAGGDTGSKRGGAAGVEQALYRDSGSDSAGCARLFDTSKGASELPLCLFLALPA